MNKAQVAAVLIVGMGLGAGSHALLPQNADAAGKQTAFEHMIMKQPALDGGSNFYVRTSALNEHGALGPANAGVLTDPAQIAAAAAYWTAVVEPSLTEKLARPGRADLFVRARDAGR